MPPCFDDESYNRKHRAGGRRRQLETLHAIYIVHAPDYFPFEVKCNEGPFVYLFSLSFSLEVKA
jgi:hypothetical protein